MIKLLNSLLLVTCLSFFFNSNNCFSQQIIKIDNHHLPTNKVLATNLQNVMTTTNITFINNNGIINNGNQNNTIIQLEINDLNYVNNLNISDKNLVKSAIIKIPMNFSSVINLNSLNQLVNLNLIYLIVENNIDDNELINSIIASNSNWIICYKISLPE